MLLKNTCLNYLTPSLFLIIPHQTILYFICIIISRLPIHKSVFRHSVGVDRDTIFALIRIYIRFPLVGVWIQIQLYFVQDLESKPTSMIQLGIFIRKANGFCLNIKIQNQKGRILAVFRGSNPDPVFSRMSDTDPVFFKA